jgi:peptidyl-prolyl cis-trans isomerase SurA
MSSARLSASALLILLLTAGGASAGTVLDRVVAVVNKEAITWSELYTAMEFEVSKDMSTPRPSEEQKREIFQENKASFLESMIDVRLQVQEAEKLEIKVSERDVESTIDNIKMKYSLDEETFIKAIRAEGFTPEKYRKKLREQILVGKLVDRKVRQRLKVTDEDVGEYLRANNLKDGVLYGIRQIYFRLPRGEDGLKALGAKTDMIQGLLEKGEDFGLLAAKYSEAPSASATGGDMGFIPKENLSAEFAAALEGLKPGQASRPFRSASGVHIIMLEGTKDVRQTLMEERFQKQFRSWLKGLRARSFIEIRL